MYVPFIFANCLQLCPWKKFKHLGMVRGDVLFLFNKGRNIYVYPHLHFNRHVDLFKYSLTYQF